VCMTVGECTFLPLDLDIFAVIFYFYFLKKLMGERNAHKYITIKNK
jgi:hypothetical protein